MTIIRFALAFTVTLALGLTTGTARADNFAVTYAEAGVENANIGSLCAHTSACIIGAQKFAGSFSGKTDYGTAGAISGVYSGDYRLLGADPYGGAHGLTDYIATFSSAGYSIALTHSAALPGINYFGFWLSALDSGNELEVLRGGSVVRTYTPADLRAAIGSQPAYFGNPSGPYRAGDAGEPFAFVNVLDLDGYFDEIKIFESPQIGGYESDNHTVGYIHPAPVPGNAIPEPVSLGLLGVGFLGCLAVRGHRAGGWPRRAVESVLMPRRGR